MNHEQIMGVTIGVAVEAISRGELPFAAVLADGRGRVVLSEHDRVFEKADPTQHAESRLVRIACRHYGPDLSRFTLYTTCEPCAMCFTSAWLAGIRKIVTGTSMAAVHARSGGRHQEMPAPAAAMNDWVAGDIELIQGVLSEECLNLFQEELFRGERPGQLRTPVPRDRG
jgi:tRNA(Arg) A34 adenosine deaminase TadA